MKMTDLVGTAGVSILLLAFFLNTFKLLAQDHPLYLWMNLVGAGLSCYASWLIPFWPFVVLEGTWGLVSLVALVRKWGR